jgi:hypothetical protein
MGFTVKKKLDLSYLGDGWTQGTHLTFSGMTFAETRDFAKLNINTEDPNNEQNLEVVMNLLKSHFVDGRGFDGTNVVDITADDLENLPTDVVTKSIELLAGNADPKS